MWLLQRRLIDYHRYWDKRLRVTDGQGRVLHQVPVGRRHFGAARRANFWEAAKLSPDRRFVVFRAADDTLRVLDLKSAP